MADPLLDVDDLTVEYETADGARPVRAVDGVSFRIGEGEVVGLVGESGCGKSTAALALFRLVPEPGRIVRGAIRFRGRDLIPLPEREIRKVRGRGLAYVPQEPGTSLNPVLRIGTQITDVIRAHRDVSRSEANRLAIEALADVGIADPERRVRAYPHELSGGMKQRALIALALAARPSLLVADEPTTAVDVTIQAALFDLLRRLVRERGMSLLLITHDLGAVAALCDRVLVMYAGRIVEEAEVEPLFDDPRHPYTRGLIASLPSPAAAPGALPAIPGQVPDLSDRPAGCAFHPRCSEAFARCRCDVPLDTPRRGGGRVACWLETPPAEEAAR